MAPLSSLPGFYSLSLTTWICLSVCLLICLSIHFLYKHIAIIIPKKANNNSIPSSIPTETSLIDLKMSFIGFFVQSSIESRLTPIWLLLLILKTTLSFF